ncbi:MAG: orotate phosphoribosyltransferase [Phycisphaerales bacterium JB060]
MESPHASARPTTTQAPNDLAGRVAEACLLRGSFTLRSGRQSSYYLDKYRFSTRPELLGPVAELLADRAAELLEPHRGVPHRLAGAELGGIPLVTACALRLGLPAIFVRNSKKEYGTAKQIEGELKAGDVVVLFEDVATSGGQAVEAVEMLREMGATIAGVVTTIDRQEGAREAVEAAGVPFHAIFTKADLGVKE